MENRFENFTVTILKLYKLIQKIKVSEIEAYGLKAIHVMCIYYLNENKQGLTAGELTKLTLEDKAAISRALTLLREKKFVTYQLGKYNAPILLTSDGECVAQYINAKIDKAVDAASAQFNAEERSFFYKSLNSITEKLTDYYRSLKDAND